MMSVASKKRVKSKTTSKTSEKRKQAKTRKPKTSFPVNYDFGAKWNNVKPFLEHPDVLKAIANGVNRYCAAFPHVTVYKPNTPMGKYSSCDHYVMLMDRKKENLLAELRRKNELPERYVELSAKQETTVSEDLECVRLREEITKPLRDWQNIKHDIESYVMLRACHWVAPTFMLTLARLVEPEESWLVRTGENHTTVINRAGTKIFDLVYWSLDGRLEHHIFGDTVRVNDPTMGGKLAFLESK